MLVTLSWWQLLDVSDRISILVTTFGCWCPTLTFEDRGCWWQKRPKPSPTFQSCRQLIFVSNVRHQHRCSPGRFSSFSSSLSGWQVRPTFFDTCTRSGCSFVLFAICGGTLIPGCCKTHLRHSMRKTFRKLLFKNIIFISDLQSYLEGGVVINSVSADEDVFDVSVQI